MTQDLKRRLDEHNSGKSKFTSAFIPWEIVYSEIYQTTAEARVQEKYLKSAAGKRVLTTKLSTGSLSD